MQGPQFHSLDALHWSLPPSHASKKPKREPIDPRDTSSSFAPTPADGNSVVAHNGLTLRRTWQEALEEKELEKGPSELPEDFLEPLPGLLVDAVPLSCKPPARPLSHSVAVNSLKRGFRQFWKAGDYEGDRVSAGIATGAGGIDHVRVHPKFLHSNATSHKWALGAVAELLDNALDEVVNGATFVNIDMIRNPRDGEPMLSIEDNGGGMSPDRIRQCMSLGYSAKNKSANTIGQYGNGFKTSTMRLGADVIVFSRSSGLGGGSSTESIGMLSYSFLRDTCKEDIIVPMVDYEIEPFGLRKLIRGNVDDWNCNMDTIKQWSPFCMEGDLLDQFKGMKHQGTRIFLYNLWEDDQGQLELDFDTDLYDIQIRGANRDEKKLSMSARYPNSRHYLTYRHSLRSYASILYLRLPPGFRMILRGKDVAHHSLVDDLMYTQELTYKPHVGTDYAQREMTMVAIVTIGFIKDAKEHVDIQGFNVYHKNRLIKPFWRIWNSSSSQGRGIIGVLEANFVEPAHDKQGFERTTVLARLETRLIQMQKSYWSKYCHKVGYAGGNAKRGRPRMSYPSTGNVKHVIHPSPVFGNGDLVEEPYCATKALHSATLNVPDSEEISRGENTAEEDPSPHKIWASPYFSDGGGARPSALSVPVKIEAFAEERAELPVKEASKEDSFNLCGAVENVEMLEECRLLHDRNENHQQEFLKEAEKNKLLEAKVSDLEHQVQNLQREIERIVKERNSLRMQLEEELSQRATEDEELRKQIKDTNLQMKYLEAENKCLSG